MQRPHQASQQRQKTTTRLKCLVLGAESAGKTSLLRRYFHNTFEESRLPTIGSDFYTGRCPDPRHPSESQIYVNLQMWDTPGRERFALKRPPRKYAATLTPAFFRQADAIMLVYDMCSSTSFTQLLKWYADLMEFQKSNRQVLPMIIVAGKLDLYRRKNVETVIDVLNNNNNNNHTEVQHQHSHYPAHSRRRRVPQRDVMGLRGNFKGKDFRYEYQVSTTTNNNNNNTTLTNASSSSLNGNSITPTNSQGGFEHDTSNGSSSSSKKRKNRRMEISSYLANRENWTTDWSYLDSLLNSEDLSHPDREMVLLWCMRNNLKHFETSAATGEGVAEAMEALLELALVAKEQQQDAAASQLPTTLRLPASVSSFSSSNQQQELRENMQQRLEKLDLHQRYASKQDNRCFLCMRPVLQLFQKAT